MRRRKRGFPIQNQVNSSLIQGTNQRLVNVEREFQELHQRLDQMRQEQVESASIFPDPVEREYENRLNSYQDHLQLIDRFTQQYLADQSQYFEDQVENFQSSVWTQTTTELDERTAWLENIISDEQAAQLSRIWQIQDALAAMQEDSAHRLEVAWNTFDAAQELINYLHHQYQTEPGWLSEMPKLANQLEQSRLNLEHGFEETALAGSQQIYNRLTELQEILERYVKDRQYAIIAFQNSTLELIQTIQQTRHVQAVDLQGEPLPIELDVDFWSEGQLRTLHRQAKRILHYLQSHPSTMELEEINHQGDHLSSIKEQIPTIVLDARIQALSSQLRFNTAECVLTALKSQGYELSFGGFEGSDQRNPYLMDLANLAGSEVFVKVSKIPQHPLDLNLELEANESGPLSEYEIRQRKNEIDAALSLFGLTIGLIPGPDSVFNPVEKIMRPNKTQDWTQLQTPKPARIDYRSH